MRCTCAQRHRNDDDINKGVGRLWGVGYLGDFVGGDCGGGLASWLQETEPSPSGWPFPCEAIPVKR